MHEFRSAKGYHERHCQIAEEVGIEDEIAKANAELYKVYKLIAEGHENAGDYEEALTMYKMCLESAKRSWDRNSEG